MVCFSTDRELGNIVYGFDIEPGSTHCLSIGSYSYDDVTEYGFAKRSSQWTNVTFGQPIQGAQRYGNPVYRVSECVYRCPIDNSLQHNAGGVPRGSGGYLQIHKREVA